MLPNEIITTIDPISHYASLIGKCITNKHINHGKSLHSHLIKTSLNLNVFLANRLIEMYAKFNSPHCAESLFNDLPGKNTHSWNSIISGLFQSGSYRKAVNLFDEMPSPNRVTYNAMISGLSRCGDHVGAVGMFRRMQKDGGFDGVLIDKFTVVSMATACASLGELGLLRQIHWGVIVMGLEINVIMNNALIDAYGKCRDPEMSFRVFERMLEKDVVSWTSVVNAYAWSSDMDRACWLFDQMPVKNAVSWTAMIAGMAQNGEGDKALGLFVRMLDEGFSPTAFTFVSVLSACADLAVIERGKQIHGHIIRSSTQNNLLNVFLYNALIDMYTKCGDMKSAKILFGVMPEKDIISWNSLVTGFAQNGHGKESIGFFKKMIESGFTPNHVTFLGVLSACSHMGLVSEGQHLFFSMEDYGLLPRSDHYAIMIDMWGRKNRLEEALRLIESAPAGCDKIGMWGALLGACRAHGNLDLASKAAEALFELEPGNSSRYIMLSNIYSAAGRWHDARRVRRLLDEKGLRKATGYSWIEVKNARHAFMAEDQSHVEKEEIYDAVLKLTDQMGEPGCEYCYGDFYAHDIE
ncbi:hypothetical protein ACHQM5_022892 [Ranunculus cassubicifolius]